MTLTLLPCICLKAFVYHFIDGQNFLFRTHTYSSHDSIKQVMEGDSMHIENKHNFFPFILLYYCLPGCLHIYDASIMIYYKLLNLSPTLIAFMCVYWPHQSSISFFQKNNGNFLEKKNGNLTYHNKSEKCTQNGHF